MVQWPRFWASTPEGLGLTPGQGGSTCAGVTEKDEDKRWPVLLAAAERSEVLTSSAQLGPGSMVLGERSQCPGRAVRSVQNRPPVEAEVRSVFARGGVGMQEVKGTGRVWGSLFSNEPK